jgi:hypothetical protein
MIIPNIWKNKKCSKPPTINQSSDTPIVNGNYFVGTCLKHELVLLSLFARNRNPSMAEKRYSMRDTTSDILQCIYMYIFTHIHGASFQCHSSSLFPRTILNPMQLQKIIVSLPHLCHQPKNNKWLIGEIPPEKKSCTVKFCRSLPCFFSQSFYIQSSRFFELQTWSNNGFDLP